VVVELHGERSLAREAQDWLGFYRRPMPADAVRQKFDGLTAGHTTAEQRDAIAQAIDHLERTPVRELTKILGDVR
jgi:2-methylcitrate dehydratase PrpD